MGKRKRSPEIEHDPPTGAGAGTRDGTDGSPPELAPSAAADHDGDPDAGDAHDDGDEATFEASPEVGGSGSDDPPAAGEPGAVPSSAPAGGDDETSSEFEGSPEWAGPIDDDADDGSPGEEPGGEEPGDGGGSGDGDGSGGGGSGGGSGGGGGTRRALCIGINEYPDQPLFGCVNDARRWHEWFAQHGFAVEPLIVDGAATRDGILDAIRRLVSGCGPGDVLAIQYAGHGTQLPDIDGDEASGDTPMLDEALVPVDHRQNGYVIDDDIGEICDTIPEGANVTFFMDCCHSGTISRGMFTSRAPASPSAARARFIAADQEMISTHRRTRAERPSTRTISSRAADDHREISFSACLSSEVAWEQDGQGDFTRHALGVLAERGPGALTHDEFVRAVKQAFGSTPRQNPLLSCADRYRADRLLAPR